MPNCAEPHVEAAGDRRRRRVCSEKERAERASDGVEAVEYDQATHRQALVVVRSEERVAPTEKLGFHGSFYRPAVTLQLQMGS